MRKWLLDYLCCPLCYQSLHLKIREACNSDIISGELLCSFCGKIYKIYNGIPRMVVKSFLGFNDRLQKIFMIFMLHFMIRLREDLPIF